ncbi:glycosyltransferase [soil metagenome]
MTSKLVSVIVAVFNQQDFVVETINSVLNQSYSNLEVIVVDDGSKDESVAILSQLKDSRLTVISLKHAGEANCKNYGFQKSSGDFVGFLDGDDVWEPTKVESHVKALNNNANAGVAYSFTSFIDKEGLTLYRETPYQAHADCYRELLRNNFMKSGSNVIHTRRSLIDAGCYDANCPILMDWDLYLRLSKRCPFVLVPEHLVRYRIHARQNSLNVGAMEKSARRLLSREFEQNSTSQLCKQQRHESFSNFYSYLRHQCLRNLSSSKIGVNKFVESVRVLALTQLYAYDANVKEDLRSAIRALNNLAFK